MSKCPKCNARLGMFGDGTVGLATYYDYPNGHNAPAVTRSVYTCAKCRHELQESSMTVNGFFDSLKQQFPLK